jgi:hypothetical protein
MSSSEGDWCSHRDVARIRTNSTDMEGVLKIPVPAPFVIGAVTAPLGARVLSRYSGRCQGSHFGGEEGGRKVRDEFRDIAAEVTV